MKVWGSCVGAPHLLSLERRTQWMQSRGFATASRASSPNATSVQAQDRNEPRQEPVGINSGRPEVHAPLERLVDLVLGRDDSDLVSARLVEECDLRVGVVIVGAGFGSLVDVAGRSSRGQPTGADRERGSEAG